MSTPEIKKENLEVMQEQLTEMTAVCKTFSNSIQLIGNNVTSFVAKSTSKFSEALKIVSSPYFQCHGNPKNWPVYKEKLLNLMWPPSISKIEAIKTVKMYSRYKQTFFTTRRFLRVN